MLKRKHLVGFAALLLAGQSGAALIATDHFLNNPAAPTAPNTANGEYVASGTANQFRRSDANGGGQNPTVPGFTGAWTGNVTSGTFAVAQWTAEVDPIVAPQGTEAHFTEKLCRLPHTYYPTNPSIPDLKPISRTQWDLPDNAVVFACFCNSWKMTPDYFTSWMDLLKSTPNSVFWILSGSRAFEANLRGEAKRQGVKPHRLIFAPRVSHERHLARHACIDVMLDTGPYGAHTTACDSLRMGVPLVVKTGATFAARVSTSILNAAGLEELAHDSFENYITCARNLALMPEKRAALRQRIGAAITSTPLFNVAQ
jgi:predicted O-linked N-acetylglucosamine transferase (SPINDLY family)